MEWVKNIQKALEFIENNLSEKELSPDLVADQVHFSSVHFSRTFYILTGFTVSEYIRNRRLSLAGEKLREGSKSVLEVALDFGYESPEAFTKAYKRFHGVNASESKTAPLKEFHPMEMKLILSQEKPLCWHVEEKEPFYLNGSATWVFGEDEASVAQVWSTCEEDGYLDTLYTFQDFEALVGVYSKGGYTIKGKCPRAQSTDYIAVPKHSWAVFSCEGEMPQAINNTWDKIYSQWMTKTKYTISELPQLEVYQDTEDGYSCEIWIGVR